MAEVVAEKKKKLKPPEEGGKKRVLARPRQRTDAGDYSFKTDGETMGGIPTDDFCFAKDAPPLRVIRPKWKGDLPTTFRAYPALNPEDLCTFLASRGSSADNDLTDWLRGVPGIKYVGIDRQISCLLYDPRWKRTKGYEVGNNPYRILYYAIKDAVDAGEAMLGSRDVLTGKWGPMFKKKMCNPSNRYTFMQGCVYQHDDRVYVAGGKPPLGLGPDDSPIVIEQQSGSGLRSLMKLLNARPEEKPDTDDILASFVHGDPTSLEAGRFFSFFNPKKHKPKIALMTGDVRVSESANEDEDVDYEEPDDAKGGKEGDFLGWEASMSEKMYYINRAGERKRAKADLTPYHDLILQRYLWWDDVLYFPSTEELCVWIAQAFRSAPNVLKFGWMDNPEFMTAEVKAVLAARTQGPGAEVPGDDDDDEEEDETAPRRSKKKSRAIPDDDEEEDEDKSRKSKNRPKNKGDKDADDDGFEDDDDEDEGDDDDEAGDDDEDAAESDDSDSDDEDSDDDDGEDADDEDSDEKDGDDDGDEDEDDDANEGDDEDSAVAKAAAAAKNRAAKRQAAAGNSTAAHSDEEAEMGSKNPAPKEAKKVKKKKKKG